jgi:hypothetical protein
MFSDSSYLAKLLAAPDSALQSRSLRPEPCDFAAFGEAPSQAETPSARLFGG